MADPKTIAVIRALGSLTLALDLKGEKGAAKLFEAFRVVDDYVETYPGEVLATDMRVLAEALVLITEDVL